MTETKHCSVPSPHPRPQQETGALLSGAVRALSSMWHTEEADHGGVM